MKAHQKIIRERRAIEGDNALLMPDAIDIKKAVVRAVDFATARKIILEYEWLGGMGNATEYYGIYFGGVCGGAVCFGFPSASASRERRHPLDSVVGVGYGKSVIQLVRGACVYWAHEHSASKLINSACKLMSIKNPDVKIVLAYSDIEAGEIGTVYQASGWLYLGETNPRGRASHYVVNGQKFDPRDALKKYGGVSRSVLGGIDPHWYKIKRTPKGQYVKWVGPRGEGRRWAASLTTRLYPKRNAVEGSRENRDNSIVEGVGQFHDTAL